MDKSNSSFRIESQFTSASLTESQLRQTYGGASFTSISRKDDDFVDNNGETYFDDCTSDKGCPDGVGPADKCE